MAETITTQVLLPENRKSLIFYDCDVCQEDFGLATYVDDWGKETEVGGISFNGLVVCDECEFPFIKEMAANERVDILEAMGYYQESITPEPDAWPVLTSQQLHDEYANEEL